MRTVTEYRAHRGSLRLATGMLCALAGLRLAAAGLGPDHRLADAAKDRDMTTVRTLLRPPATAADVNATQGDAATALHWASHWDDVEVANLLLRAGANVDAADDHGVTPLWLACLNGSAAMVKALLEAHANVNSATLVGETPLMMAAHTGNVEVVRLLLARGADVTATEKTLGQTALMRAVADNHPDIVRLLIASGPGVGTRSKNKFTPLLFAAQQGNIDIARMLLAAGSDVNESAPDGIAGDTNALRAFKPDTESTALLVAIDSHHEAMAAFLLEKGADPNRRGAGRTALHSAVQQAMPDIVKALLAHGADPNARLEKPMPLLSRFITQATGLEINTIGATPFWLAASYDDAPIMRLLVNGGADATITSNDRTSPLMVAAGVDFVEGQDKYGRRWFQLDTAPLQTRAIDAMQYCLDVGNDINAVNDKGQTALHGAVYFGGTMLVPFLVERGARMNVLNARQQTPWIITQGEYQAGSFIVHKETGDVLETLGADTHLGGDIGREAALAALRGR
jgi:ankyrin repeat protein